MNISEKMNLNIAWHTVFPVYNTTEGNKRFQSKKCGAEKVSRIIERILHSPEIKRQMNMNISTYQLWFIIIFVCKSWAPHTLLMIKFERCAVLTEGKKSNLNSLYVSFQFLCSSSIPYAEYDSLCPINSNRSQLYWLYKSTSWVCLGNRKKKLFT